MKIIAIEGLDKAGKFSQTELLKNFLEEKGYHVVKSEFHRYDTPTGELIMKWLQKKWDVDQHTIELIMAADKQAQQLWFDKLEAEGVDFLVLDRYTGSQKAYARANYVNPVWTEELQRYMRQPDLEIFIDIPAEESMRRKGKHNNGENDRYESDLEMLERVRQFFTGVIDVKVNGVQSPEEVHQAIVQRVKLAFVELR
jgi:dTMP kinase